MGRLIRIAVTVIVLSALVLGGILYSRYQEAVASAETSGSRIEDETVVRRDDLLVTVSGTGSLTPVRLVGLTFELSAPVVEVLVREGQVVNAGDVLARLDTSTLEAALTQAQIAFETQQVSYDALTAPASEADIAVAQAAVNVALAQSGAASLGATDADIQIAQYQAEIARNQLWQAQLQRGLTGGSVDEITPAIQGADNQVALSDVNVSGVENEPADVAALSAANAQLVSAQAALDRLINGPTEMELELAAIQLEMARLTLEAAEVALNRATLSAPFSGVVARNHLVVGELPPQGAAIELIDASGYYVDIAVDETDIVDLQVGQTAGIRLDALPDASITGVVTRVAVTPIQNGQLVTYPVRVTLEVTDAPVRAGMTATTTILVREVADALILPNRFIRIDRATQGATVTVERAEGVFEDVAVQLGVRNESVSQIVSGLDEGQRVVLLPHEAFNPLG